MCGGPRGRRQRGRTDAQARSCPGDGRAGVARRDRSGRPRSGAGGRRRVEPPGGAADRRRPGLVGRAERVHGGRAEDDRRGRRRAGGGRLPRRQEAPARRRGRRERRPEHGFVPVRRRPDVGLRQRQGPADAVALSQGSEGAVAMNTLVIRWGALAALLAAALVVVGVASAASHREAPLISLDAEADITDFYAFRSYEPGQADKVDLIMDVIPFEEPSGGPNYYNFDPSVAYTFHVDNDKDGDAGDVEFQFRFTNEIRGAVNSLGLPFSYVGGVPPATGAVIPPITSLDSPGLGLRQHYT